MVLVTVFAGLDVSAPKLNEGTREWSKNVEPRIIVPGLA